MSAPYLAFPFGLTASGRVASTDLEGALHGRIEQVLFTAPGERVMRPEFGCGVRNLVFQPNNEVLAAATEFTVARALHSALSHLLMVNAVNVQAEQEVLRIEIVYTRNSDLQREQVVFQLTPQEGGNRE